MGDGRDHRKRPFDLGLADMDEDHVVTEEDLVSKKTR